MSNAYFTCLSQFLKVSYFWPVFSHRPYSVCLTISLEPLVPLTEINLNTGLPRSGKTIWKIKKKNPGQ